MRDTHAPSIPTWQAEPLLVRCADGLLLATLFGVPLLMGGRQALGQLVLVVLALALGIVWCLRQYLSGRGTWSWAEIVLSAAIGLLALQLLPLRPAVLQALSPHLYEILPLWSPGTEPSTRFGVWTCLSLTPAQTRDSLALLAAVAVVFLVTVQRVRKLDDVERLLRWVAVAGVLMATFGLVQYFAGNGKFFWFYEHPFTNTSDNVKGSFANRNHFAHFVVLTIGPLLWWIQKGLFRESVARSNQPRQAGFARPRDSNAGFLVVALGCCVFAVLMSLSRGGIAVLFLSSVLSVGILYRGSLLDGKTVLFLAGTGLLVVVSLGVYGYHAVSARIDDFQSIQQLDKLHQRTNLWRADLAAAKDFLWIGSGVGSHVEVNPTYLPDSQVSQNYQYTHAENGYLQVAMEAGIAGLLLALAAIALVGTWCLPVLRRDISRRALLCYVGIVPSFAASLLHSLVDFVWYVPGCMVVVVLLAACACRLAQLIRSHAVPARDVPVPRLAWLLVVPALLLLGCLMVPRLFGAVLAEPSWYRALAQWTHLETGDNPDDEKDLQSVAQDLSYVVTWQPDHALAHSQLAEVYLRLFYYAQGPGALDARQVRDAALNSQFPSRAALKAWLERAFGTSQRHLDLALAHARRAAALCPVHGQTYLRLAALTFLDGPSVPDKSRCIQQALALRPFDGSVLFQAGQEAALANDPPAAYALFRRSFQCGDQHQDRLIRLLAGELSASSFLEAFPMDLRAISSLEAQYRRLNRSDDLKVVLGVRAATAAGEATGLGGAGAVGMWVSAAHAYRELGQYDACVHCLEQAMQWGRSDYSLRLLLGTCLFQANRYAEAEEHLAWCQQRTPDNAALRSMLEKVVSQRLSVTRRTSSAERN